MIELQTVALIFSHALLFDRLSVEIQCWMRWGLIAYITLWVVFPMSFDHLPIRNPKFGTSDLDWTATFCAQDPNNVSLQKMAMIGNWRGDTDSN